MDVVKYISVKSNWQPEEADRNISEIVHLSVSGFNSQCDNGISPLTINPLNLCPAKNSLKIEIDAEDDKFLIEHINISSEARVVEVFGKQDMYITSVFGTKSEEHEDHYKVEISLNNLPLSKCTLTLLQWLKYDSFRLFGIQITIVPNMNRSMQMINYNHVNSLLTGTYLSDKAVKCKEFIQNFNKNSSNLENFLTCGLKNGAVGEILLKNETFNTAETSTAVNGKMPINSQVDMHTLFRKVEQLDEKLNRILEDNKETNLFFRTKTEEITNQIQLLNEKMDKLTRN